MIALIKILLLLYTPLPVIGNGVYIMGSHKYPQLNDQEWLIQKYEKEQMSTIQISEILGCKDSNSVRQALIRFGIHVRGWREAQVFKRDDDFRLDDEVVSGTLLGDASLNKSSKKSSITAPYYAKKCKWEDYSLHVGELLTHSNNINLSFQEYQLKTKKYNSHIEYFVFRTRTSDILTPFFEKWYPASNNYKKLVPRDLILTPRTVLYWFLDDGSSSYRNRTSDYKTSGWTQRKKQIRICFCSESFSKEDNEFLCQQLQNFGLNASVKKCSQGTGWRIGIGQSSSNDFFDFIGECPVDSMKYKWKFSNFLNTQE